MLQGINLKTFKYLEKEDKEKFLDDLYTKAGFQVKENNSLDKSGLNKLRGKLT